MSGGVEEKRITQISVILIQADFKCGSGVIAISKYPGAGTNHVSIAFIAVLLIVAVIITKGRDAIFQKTGQFKITTETRSADSDDVNSVFLRCPAIQAAIKASIRINSASPPRAAHVWPAQIPVRYYPVLS